MQVSREIRNILLAVYDAPTDDAELTRLYIEAFVDVADTLEDMEDPTCVLCTSTMVAAVENVSINCVVCCLNCRGAICFGCTWRSASSNNGTCPACNNDIQCLRLTTNQITYCESNDIIVLDNIARYGNVDGPIEYDSDESVAISLGYDSDSDSDSDNHSDIFGPNL
jgi:hypothetical protein